MSDFDWENWQSKIEATLMFIVSDGKILLIEKKRGHGAGKINGPGGKIDPGETPRECVIRETQEELLISVKNPEKRAELWFEMSDYPSLRCHVYLASDFTNTPSETEEAIPMWFDLEKIPYENMWEDDKYWLPRVLNGEKLLGKFRFNGETMIEHLIIHATFPESP